MVYSYLLAFATRPTHFILFFLLYFTLSRLIKKIYRFPLSANIWLLFDDRLKKKNPPRNTFILTHMPCFVVHVPCRVRVFVIIDVKKRKNGKVQSGCDVVKEKKG